MSKTETLDENLQKINRVARKLEGKQILSKPSRLRADQTMLTTQAIDKDE